MKVLLVGRQDAPQASGGDMVQLLSTARALRDQGIDVETSLGLSCVPSEFDVVHLFNLTKWEETGEQMQLAKQADVAIALSTVYWSFEELENVYARMSPAKYWVKRRLGSAPGRAALRLAETMLGHKSFLSRQLQDRLRAQASLVQSADILLPNSGIEMERLRLDLGIDSDFVVVPNAVEPDFALWAGDVSSEIERIGPYILCVANICVRKNQLLLIRAAQDLGLPLVLAGRLDGGFRAEKRYVNELLGHQGKGVHVLGPIDRRLLPAVYRHARVHALVSWFETPGLSSLEAALCGCAVVSTDRGSAREYFLDHAHYCSPDSFTSIRDAVEDAWHRGSDPELASRVKERYTWAEAAAATIDGYEIALRKRRGGTSAVE